MRISVVVLLSAIALISTSCGADSASEQAPLVIGNCTADQVFNPITGACEAKAVPGSKAPGTNVDDPTPNETFSSDDPWAENDSDGIVDREDNCPFDANPDQADTDSDGIGDACDNCVNAANTDQADSSGTGIGDACNGSPVGDICGQQNSGFVRLKPSIYFVLDKSGSMEGTPMTQAKAGLDSIADDLAADVQFGFGAYPITLTCGQSHTDFLPMGEYSPAQIKASYQAIEPGGGTSTADALETVLRDNLYTANNDPDAALRSKAVVLITDGEPNACGELPGSINAARALAQAGVPVYVIGFNFGGANPSNLNQIAEAGGTDAGINGARYYLANNASQLVTAIRDISDNVISCSYKLDTMPEDPNKVWVAINNAYLDRSAYSVDATGTLALDQTTCDNLQREDPNATNVEITLGCATQCNPAEFWGCCVDDAGSCTTDDDCCFGSCNAGSCEAPCRPNLVTGCETNDDCCTGMCVPDSATGKKICIDG